MKMMEILESIGRVESAITEVYGRLNLLFEENPSLESFWEEMFRGRKDLLLLLEKCRMVVPQDSQDRIPGKDIRYPEILDQIGGYDREIQKEEIGINEAFRIAFRMESLSIRSVFNEMIKLPREPFFHLLSEIHLKVRENMGRLIRGIETFCTDRDLLHQVLEIKEGVVERRSGEDRRMEREGSSAGMDRRKEDRRKGDLVQLLWH